MLKSLLDIATNKVEQNQKQPRHLPELFCYHQIILYIQMIRGCKRNAKPYIFYVYALEPAFLNHL